MLTCFRHTGPGAVLGRKWELKLMFGHSVKSVYITTLTSRKRQYMRCKLASLHSPSSVILDSELKKFSEFKVMHNTHCSFSFTSHLLFAFINCRWHNWLPAAVSLCQKGLLQFFNVCVAVVQNLHFEQRILVKSTQFLEWEISPCHFSSEHIQQCTVIFRWSIISSNYYFSKI